MAIALEEAPALDLGEPPQALGVEQLQSPLQLGELLLDPSIRKVGHGLPPQRLDARIEGFGIEHMFDADGCGAAAL